MKKREKRGAFANRINMRKKQAKSSQWTENAAAFLSFYIFIHQKYIRKSPPFWTKTDLRTAALFVYTMQQELPKTTRLEA